MDIDKPLVPEKLVDGKAYRRPDAGNGSETVRARPEMGNGAKKFEGMPFFLQGINIWVRPAIYLYLPGQQFNFLPLCW